jgi:hypothetical protein
VAQISHQSVKEKFRIFNAFWKFVSFIVNLHVPMDFLNLGLEAACLVVQYLLLDRKLL